MAKKKNTLSVNLGLVEIKSVKPNGAVILEYHNSLRKLVHNMSLEFIDEVLSDYKGFFVDSMAMDASVNNMEAKISKCKNAWQRMFNDKAPELAKKFISRVALAVQLSLAANIRKSAGFKVKLPNSLKRRQILKMIVTENVNLIKSIPSQYFLEVERIVFEAIANGNKIDELKSELLKRYAITNRRAKLIAKDQIKKATEMLERRQLIDAGVTKGFWLHSGNYKPGRARKSHVEAAQRAKRGEWYDLRKGMLIDGRFTHPKELVNCNCTRKIYAELRQLSRFAVDKNIRMAA